MKSKLIKTILFYPKLRKKFFEYIEGVNPLPEGWSKRRLFRDYIKVRFQHPEMRVTMSEYMIFGFYNLSRDEIEEYLTDSEATRLMLPYNADAKLHLWFKDSFLREFSDYVNRAWLLVAQSTQEQFEEFLRLHPVVAAKPVSSSWGIGFRKIDAANVTDMEALYTTLSNKKYILEEFLTSAPELAKYHPASLNTLRVITFYNSGHFTVFGAGLRVGNNNKNVDNAHGGGIFCEINTDTGIIETDGLDEFGNTYPVHPLTGVPFRGQQIPRWQEIIALCRSAAAQLSCLRIVGWDVALLSDGRMELIEGNHNPGMNIVQAAAKHGVRRKFKSLLEEYFGDISEETEENYVSVGI